MKQNSTYSVSIQATLSCKTPFTRPSQPAAPIGTGYPHISKDHTSIKTHKQKIMNMFTTKNRFPKSVLRTLESICTLIILLMAGVFFSVQSQAQTTVTLTPANTTWVCPTGVFSVNVECWGGGGAGGGATGNPAAGGGGGGGSYVKNISIAVVPGTTYNVSVGGGAAGSTSAGANGGDTWFMTSGTLLAKGGLGGGLASSNSQTTSGALALSTGNVGATAPFSYYGGAGGTGGASGASGGGGGSSAGTGSNGNAATGVTGGSVVTGGGAGVNGSTSSADGADNAAVGGGGAGGRAGSGTDRLGGNGGNGQIKITYTALTYKSQLVSMSLGSTSWCPGETRNVSIQIKNNGTATWTDGSPEINIGVKWNTNGANWADYYIRVDAGNLAPGATGTYVLPITASNNIGAGYTTPLAAGTNNLTFDVVYEGVSWFGDNGGGTGPGNAKFISPNQTILAAPTITKGSNPSACPGSAGSLTYSATTGTPTQYSIDYDAAANSAGFTDVLNATLPASQIPMAVPLGVSAGTYNATLSVRNTTTGCSSTPVAIGVTVLATPVTTGVTICTGGSGSLTSSTTCPGFINSGTSISGTWTAGTDPTANRLNEGITNSATCAFESPAVTRNYVTQNFQVSATGSYTFAMNTSASYDGMGYIVTGAFVPGNCAGGGTFVRGDDDNGPSDEPSMTATLTAGITYTLISTTYSASSGTYSGSFVWTITPPAGEQIMLPVSTAIQWFTTASGGTAIGSGSSFNPVGVAGSGLANTNTPGTTVFYAMCLANPVCRTATSFVISPNAAISLTTGSSAQPACKNAAMSNLVYTTANGATSASIISGALPAGVSGNFAAGLFTISGTPTAVGTFNYTISTTGGCGVAAVSGSIIVNNPPTATFAKTMASACGGGNDGTITVTPTSGPAPYAYSWTSTPAGFSASTAAVTGLSSRDYTVTVTDANTCSVSIPDITIWQALPAVVSNNGGGSGSCGNTGHIILYGSGGVQPYTYSVNGVNYQSGNTFNNLAAGTYTGYVKDFGGCVTTKPNIVVTGAAAMVVTANTRPASSCANNGTIELYRTGGVAPYTYSLNDITYQSGNVFNSLAGATTYTGWVKDAKGCKTSLAGIVVGKAPAITVSTTKTNTSACSNSGTIRITGGGGVPGYTYSLNNVSYQAGNTFTGLAAGSYNAWVMDSKGCKNVQFSVTIGTDAAATITVTASTGNPGSCTNNGSIHLFKTGGVAPFSYSLDDVTYQSSPVFTGLAAGNYSGWVKDSKGCKGSLANIILTAAASLNVTESHTNSSVCVNDGTVQLRHTGGTGPFTYSLDDISYQAGNSFSGLAVGNYTGWVKDINGCKGSVSIGIAQNPITVTVYVKDATACATGSIQLFRNGGVAPYTYSIDGSNYQNSPHFNGLNAGTYTGYVKDSKACIGTLANIVVGPACDAPAPIANTGKNSKVTGAIVNNKNILTVQAYPNPSATEFILGIETANEERVSIQVTDIMGRTVHQATTGSRQYRFGASLKAGIYLVKIAVGDKLQSIKVIKE